MATRNLKVVVDTNVWVSLCFGHNLLNLEQELRERQISILLSRRLLQEVYDTFQKPKLQTLLSQKQLNDLQSLFQHRGNIIEVSSEVEVCRDHNDNFLLELAKDGEADYLVTGDQDLLVLEKFQKTEIITWRNWFNLLFDE